MSYHLTILGSYLQTLEVPLIRGGFFTAQDRDGSLPVVMVTRALARRYWPGEDPIGKRIKWGPAESHSPWLTVVGVAGDVKQGPLDTPAEPHTYQPFEQLNDSAVTTVGRSIHLAVRAAGDPAGVTAALRAQLRSLDPDTPLTDVRSLDQILSGSMPPR